MLPTRNRERRKARKGFYFLKTQPVSMMVLDDARADPIGLPARDGLSFGTSALVCYRLNLGGVCCLVHGGRLQFYRVVPPPRLSLLATQKMYSTYSYIPGPGPGTGYSIRTVKCDE